MDHRGPILLAERILNLLDEGSFTATYKYAVLIALLDLCLEGADSKGRAPESVTTRQLAEKVLEIYWPHAREYQQGSRGRVLRQNTKGQAEILARIEAFQQRIEHPFMGLAAARAHAHDQYRRLVDQIEGVLIRMPLPRLQVVGNHEDRFLYQIAWRREDVDRLRGEVSRYQRGGGDFDNIIRFQHGVADALVSLNSLLRPLLYHQWSRMVARINGLEQTRLEDFLFGSTRTSLQAIRGDLLEAQDGRCFYCGGSITRGAEVDHFIPWSRCPDDGIFNLVVADERCNGWKRDFFAANAHLERWWRRMTPGSDEAAALTSIAAKRHWDADTARTRAIARSTYLRLPERATLWLQGRDRFENADPDRLRGILAREASA